MTTFDKALFSFPNAIGYYGNPPENENEYNQLEWMQDWDNPTWAEIETAISQVKQQDCKTEAKKRIADCDWSVLPDVNISNKSDFEIYRATLRDLIVNPVADPVWPTEPQPVWV